MGKGASFWTVIAFLAVFAPSADGFGYMNTLSTLWGGNPTANSFSVCSIEAGTGTPRCWGTFSISNSSRPPSNISLWSLTGGGYFSCGLTDGSHNPVCWGQTPGSAVPEAFQNVSYSSINCGGWHACAIREKSSNPSDEGKIDCWGDNTFEQASPPQSIPMRSVSAGDYFTCGLTQFTGRVVCWGHMTNSNDTQLQVNQQALFDSIAAGRTHICGIRSDNKLALCWGSNEHGQSSPLTNVSFSALAAGMYHTCGIRLADHQVVCWGDNSLGQSKAPKGVGFSVITAGDRYTCGVRMDSMVVDCWGNEVAVPSLKFNTLQGVCSKRRCRVTEFELSSVSKIGDDQQEHTRVEEDPECKICAPCAVCGNGTFVISSCGAIKDTICADCSVCSMNEGEPCSAVCDGDVEFFGRRRPAAAGPGGHPRPPHSPKTTAVNDQKSAAVGISAAAAGNLMIIVALILG